MKTPEAIQKEKILFDNQLDSLLNLYPKKIVVFMNGKVQAAFDNNVDACIFAKDHNMLGKCLVTPVRPIEESQYVFHNNNIRFE